MSRLTEAQEGVVVQWCARAFGDGGGSDEQGKLKEIEAFANGLLVGEYGDETQRVSSIWAKRFLERHPEIRMQKVGAMMGSDVVVDCCYHGDRPSSGLARGRGGQCFSAQSGKTSNCAEVQQLRAALETARKENEKLVAKLRELEEELKER